MAAAQGKEQRRSLWGAGLMGIALMAGVDEIIFHQILAWHHFYDRATPALALLSDGLLHAGELLALVTGFFVLLDLQRLQTLSKPHLWAGIFLGLGGFQLFDGIIDHKVLRLHQIRYDVYLLPYDIAWNLVGLLLLMVGLWRLNRARTTVSTT